MNDLISVIVPVYKVEDYLEKCITSIINQTYKNLEIILVDDGSPDKCGEICDKFAKKDKRIIVLHKKNGGLSDARNKGLEKATGKYVSFIDSDDFISSDYFEYLYKILNENDADMSVILPYKFSTYESIKTDEKKEKIEIYNSKEALITMLYQKKFDNAAWGKLYKKEIIENIEFPVGKLYEDIGTTYKYILNSNKIVYSDRKIYYYLQRPDSIMGKPFRIKEMDYIDQTSILLEDMKKLQDIELIKAAESRYVNANFSVLLKIKKNEEFKKERNIILNNIKKYRNNVFFDKKVRTKTKVALILMSLNIL